jgi:hypothetical protein
MDNITLEQVIRQNIPLSARPNGQGWYSVLCKVCNDHGRKGKRAGFRFDNNTVGYNCFNCGHTALFNPAEHRSLSRDMVATLEAFGMKKEDWQPAVFSAAASSEFGYQHNSVKIAQANEPTTVELPPFITPLDPDGDDFDQYAIEYLTKERAVDWTQYPFFIGRKSPNPSSHKWYGRLVIPIYKDGKLIFYHGRDLTETRERKYLNPDISRENVLYGYEHIFKNVDDPLYIVEGWFDAWHLEGVAVLGSKMSSNHLYWINQSQRPKVVIPDRTGDGFRLAEQALELGWSISTPDIGDCKDPNEAVIKYGKLFTLMTIRTHTYEGFEAALRLKFYCEKNNDDTRTSPHIRKGTHQV